jgi:hemerythrin-like metal-binding protein
MNISAHFHVIPICSIKNGIVVQTNEQFNKEFKYPENGVSVNIPKNKSTETINNKTYTIYNIGSNGEDILLFFNKEYLPDLSNKCDNVKKLTQINLNQLYITHVVSVDNQHIELANTINHIIVQLKDGCELEDILFNLHFLIGHTKDHFNHEETLMKENGLCMPEHVIDHENLINIITTLIYNINMENLVRSVDYLKNWLLDHIVTHDKLLCEHLKNKK